jgi:hypothetical protein
MKDRDAAVRERQRERVNCRGNSTDTYLSILHTRVPEVKLCSSESLEFFSRKSNKNGSMLMKLY